MRSSFLALLRCLLCAACCGATGAQALFEENEVKAAVVYHLSLFTEWPNGGQRENFRMCVITEQDAMADALSRLGGKSVRGARLEVLRKRPVHDLAGCQVVYLGEMSEAARNRIVGQLAGRPVLVVADAGLETPGAMVRIDLAGERVLFDIDLQAVHRSNLRLDPKALRLARSVQQ